MTDQWTQMFTASPARITTSAGESEFHVLDISRQLTGRVYRRESTGVPGAALGSTGLGAEVIQITTIWGNQMDPLPGLGAKANLWPVAAARFEALLRMAHDQDETITLDLPWRFGIRCRPVSWTASLVANERCQETMPVTFELDNERKVVATTLPTARNTLERALGPTLLSGIAKRGLAQPSLVSQIKGGIARLKGMLDAPARELGRITAQVATVRASVESLRDDIRGGAGTREASVEALEELELVLDVLGGVTQEAQRSPVTTRTILVMVDTTMIVLASTYRVDLEAIRELNPGLNPNRIPAGSRVLVPGTRQV